MKKCINVIGAGLAGVEVAAKVSEYGFNVRLYEMKPEKYSPAHKSEKFSELVCSNSLRSNDPANAAGLLKEEMRALGSLIIKAADETKVPAGKALAVDRELFSEYITEKLLSDENIEIVHREITSLEDIDKADYTVIATGPLTSDAFAKEIGQMTGENYLYFYDGIAPIIDAESIDFSKGFKASRYGYGGDDYWNFPMTEMEYVEFLMYLAGAERVKTHNFESPKYFEGCLPIEVMADRGPETLRHGPMKPFGLTDPRTGEEPYALIQLRQEDKDRSMFNMVGFQTKLTWPEQQRIFKMIPGLENAKFLRLGAVHRNTFINSPKVLDENLGFIRQNDLYFAGQITGVEGYIESAASGLWLGHFLGRKLSDNILEPPPHTTAIGCLLWHVANPKHRNFQPMNVNFGLMPIIKGKIPKKMRKTATMERAKRDFCEWQIRQNLCHS